MILHRNIKANSKTKFMVKNRAKLFKLRNHKEFNTKYRFNGYSLNYLISNYPLFRRTKSGSLK